MLPHRFSSPGHVPGSLQAWMGIRQVPAAPASSNHSAQSQAGAGQALAVQKACANSQKKTKLTSYFDCNVPGVMLKAMKGRCGQCHPPEASWLQPSWAGFGEKPELGVSWLKH